MSINVRLFALLIPTLLLFASGTYQRAEGATAVAIGTASDGTKRYSWWVASTEEVAKEKAIGSCAGVGGLNPQIMMSTAQRGYGAIVSFDNGDKKFDFVASVAATSEPEAVHEALEKARAAGGKRAWVVTTWHDVVRGIIDLTSPTSY